MIENRESANTAEAVVKEPSEPKYWKKCSRCKREIKFSSHYFKCSVSTCNKKRAPMTFCSEGCWDSHIPIMNHRSAWYETKHAPSLVEYQIELKTAAASSKKSVRSSEMLSDRIAEQPSKIVDSGQAIREILIVASRLKNYVEQRASMKVSQRVMVLLSDHVRSLCDAAIVSASKHGRKTVLDRDFPDELYARPLENDTILVIVSKSKFYIKEKSGFNSSKAIFAVLSQEIREQIKKAIREAGMDDRRTLLERDLSF